MKRLINNLLDKIFGYIPQPEPDGIEEEMEWCKNWLTINKVSN